MPLMFGVGPTEILLVLLLIIIVFGASKIPQLGAGLGQGIRNFKESLSGKDEKNLEDGTDEK